MKRRYGFKLFYHEKDLLSTDDSGWHKNPETNL